MKVQKCDLPRLGPMMHEVHWRVFHLRCGGEVLRDLPCSKQTYCQEENCIFTIRFLKGAERSKESEQCKMYHTITVYTTVLLKMNPWVRNL